MTISDIMHGSQNRESLPQRQRAQIGKLFPDGISTYSEKYSPLVMLELEEITIEEFHVKGRYVVNLYINIIVLNYRT